MTEDVEEIKIKFLDHFKNAGIKVGVIIDYAAIEIGVTNKHTACYNVYFSESNGKTIKDIADIAMGFSTECYPDPLEYHLNILYSVNFNELGGSCYGITFHESLRQFQDFIGDRIIFDFCNFKKDLAISDHLKTLTYIRIQQCHLQNLSINCSSVKSLELTGVRVKKRTHISISNLVNSLNIIRCEFIDRLVMSNLKLEESSSIMISKSSFHGFMDVSSDEKLQYLKRAILRDNNWNFGKIKPKGFFNCITGKTTTNNRFSNSIYNDIDLQQHSFRLLKSYYLKKGLQFEVHQFQRLINHINLTKDHLITRDRFMLLCARISNDFGTNYVRGIIFILVTSLFFYLSLLVTLYANDEIIFTLSKDSFISFIAHFLDFTNISKWEIDFFGLKENNIVNIFLYLGRVFVGFGIYQTITSFRRSSNI
jgi:uncharacterized protein YaaR (DUF327 family)